MNDLKTSLVCAEFLFLWASFSICYFLLTRRFRESFPDFPWNFFQTITEATENPVTWEPENSSVMEHFAKKVNGWKQVTIFGKSSSLDVWLGAECVFSADNYFSKKAPAYMFNWVPNTSFQPITIFEKSSSLDVWLGAKYVFSAGYYFWKTLQLRCLTGCQMSFQPALFSKKAPA